MRLCELIVNRTHLYLSISFIQTVARIRTRPIIFFSFFFLFSFLLTNDRIPITIQSIYNYDRFITEVHRFLLITKVRIQQQSLRYRQEIFIFSFFKHGSRHIFPVHRHLAQSIVMSRSLVATCLSLAIDQLLKVIQFTYNSKNDK